MDLFLTNQRFRIRIREHFSCNLFLLKLDILGSRFVPLEKEGQFYLGFLESFEILELPFFCDLPQKTICCKVFLPVVYSGL